MATIQERLPSTTEGSYTQRLIQEDGLLESKLIEEARELVNATSTDEANQEMADLLYFALVKLSQLGGDLEQVEHILDARSLKLTRRQGDRKC